MRTGKLTAEEETRTAKPAVRVSSLVMIVGALKRIHKHRCMRHPAAERCSALRLPLAVPPFAQVISQFNQAVDQQAQPEVHQSSKIEFEGVMLGGGRQIRVEGKI